MRRRLIFRGCLLVIGGAFGALLLSAADPVKNPLIPENEVLMRAKLSSSQKVLEGLLAEDFTLIAHGAREMKKISEAAEWPRSGDAVYEHFAAEFRRQCDKLESLANKTNREGATFTYLQMTTTCIDCHDHVRDSLRIAEHPNGGVRLIPAQLPHE